MKRKYFSIKQLGLFLAMGVISTSVYANTALQSVKVTVNHKNAPISKVLDDIEQQTGYSILVRNNDINIKQKVTVNVTGSLNTVLADVFEGMEVKYNVENKTISIYKEKTPSFVASSVNQDKKTVTGTIVDQNGEPIIGANVSIPGTTTGTISDVDGRFSIEVPENAQLQISFIGYLSQVISVENKTVINVKLQEDTQKLDEVVVVGYMTQKKGLLTGSVEHMRVDEQMKTLPTTAAGNLLAGRLAGVNVSTPSAAPGSNPDVSIRTVSAWERDNKKQQPVCYVIDGVIRDASDFNNLSPNEIDDITVLKDAASAAVYGSRSAGGVILVTTKKGKLGKPTVNYSYSYAIDTRTKNMDLTSAVEAGELYGRINGDTDPAGWAWSQEELDYFKGINDGWGYDQLDLIWRNPSTQTHNISVSGGNEKIRYFAGGSYVKQEGFMEPMTYDKYNLRLNVTADITKDLKVETGLSLNNNKQGLLAEDYDEVNRDTYTKLRIWQPDQPVYTDSGQYIDYGWIGNVGAKAAGAGGYRKHEYLKPQMLVSATYKAPFLEGLSARVAFSKQWYHEAQKKFYKSYEMQIMQRTGPNNRIMSTNDNDIIGVKKSTWGLPNGKDMIERVSKWNDNMQLNFQLSYDKVFNNVHHVSGTFVTEWYEASGTGVTGGRESFPLYLTDQFWAASDARADSWANGDVDWQDGRMSYIGQFSYDYANKYMFTFSFREDGSMKFVPSQRWGFFPAASAGWVLSEESWFNTSKINRLKVRASAGLTGDDSVGGWQWMESYEAGKKAYFGKSPAQNVGLTYGKVVNPDMTWEKSFSFDLGADMNFLDHWDLSFDYWYRNTYDILDTRVVSTPTTFSQKLPAENYGEVHAQGIDLRLGYNGASGDFTYFGNLTASYGWNEVVTKDYAENAKWFDVPVGRSLSYITGLEVDQIIRTQADLDAFNAAHPNYLHKGQKPELGMMVYKDLSGPQGTPDGIIDDWDKTILKNKNNPFIVGLNLGGTWKGFGLDMMFTGHFAEYKWADDLAGGVEWNRMWHDWYDNSWTSENPNAELPKRKSANVTRTYDDKSDFWLKKNNYLRMKYLTVSYTLPENQFYNKVFNNVRLFFTGTNLFVLGGFNKNYYDPEIGQGNEFPISRSFNFGIDVTF